MIIDKIIWEGKEIDSYDGKVIDEIIFDGEPCSFGVESDSIESSEPDIPFEDTVPAPLRSLKVVGESRQEQYQGYNLISYPYENTTKTANGITFTDNGDGSITANGTATSDAYFILSYHKFYGDKNVNAIYDVATNGQYTFSKGLFYSGDNAYYPLSITIPSGVTVNNEVFYPQVNLGTQLRTWEPYVGGVPSPNPEYPQAIKSAVSKSGKNYFDVGKLRNNGGLIMSASGNTLSLTSSKSDEYPAVIFMSSDKELFGTRLRLKCKFSIENDSRVKAFISVRHTYDWSSETNLGQFTSNVGETSGVIDFTTNYEVPAYTEGATVYVAFFFWNQSGEVINSKLTYSDISIVRETVSTPYSDLDISVHGENLFNVYAITGADKGGGYRDGDTLYNPYGHYGNTTWFLGYSMRLEPGWYHISADCFTSTSETGQVVGRFVDPTKSPIVYSGNPAYLPISINTWTRFNWRVSIETAGEYYVHLTGGGNASNYDHLDVRFKNIMITKEVSYDVYPPYEPYFNSSVTISGLSDIPLRAIGDQRDELIIDGGKRTVKHIKRIVPFTAPAWNEFYSNGLAQSLGYNVYQLALYNMETDPSKMESSISDDFNSFGLSNMFRNEAFNPFVDSLVYATPNTNTISIIENHLLIYKNNESLEDFVQWWNENKSAIEIYYALKTPIETDLTDTEIGKELLALSTGRGDLTLSITPSSGVNPKSVTVRHWKQKRPN